MLHLTTRRFHEVQLRETPDSKDYITVRITTRGSNKLRYQVLTPHGTKEEVNLWSGVAAEFISAMPDRLPKDAHVQDVCANAMKSVESFLNEEPTWTAKDSGTQK